MVVLCLVKKHKFCKHSCRFSLLPCPDFRIVWKQGGVIAVDVGDVSRDSTALGQHIVTVHQRGHGMLRVDLKTTKNCLGKINYLGRKQTFFLGGKKHTISAYKTTKIYYSKTMLFSRLRGSSTPSCPPLHIYNTFNVVFSLE